MVEAVRVVSGVGHEPEPRTEVEEDIRGLGEHEGAVPENGRRERGRVVRGAEGGGGRCVFLDGGDRGGRVGEVGVGGSGRFEGEADVFGAAGDGGPVDQFVRGRGGGGRGRHGGLGGTKRLEYQITYFTG